MKFLNTRLRKGVGGYAGNMFMQVENYRQSKPALVARIWQSRLATY